MRLTLRERGSELAAIGRAIAESASGHGQLVTVEGHAGTGKSALLAATLAMADQARLTTFTARAGDLEQEFAFGVVRQLFEGPTRALPTSERDDLFEGAAAPARWALDPPVATEPDHLGGGFAVLRAIFWMVSNLAQDGALLVAVDDAHWADRSSLRALCFLARRIAELPVALVVAMRDGEPAASADLLDELRGEPAAVRLTMRPLSRSACGALVRERLAHADAAVGDAVHDATAGNPLYLEELLRSLDGETLRGPDAVAVIQESALPSLGERLARRIGRVAPEAVRLAKAMSVLSDGARLADAARLSDLPEAQAATIAARLQRLEVLAAAEPVEFAHPLVRRSIYELQSVTERDDAHRAAAALLIAADAGAEQAATHLAMVRPSGSVETVGVLARAAEQAVARAAPDEASFWLRRALAEQAPDPPRAQLLAQLGQVALAIRDPAATGYLQQALDEAREPWLRARAAVALAEMMMMGGRWEAGRRVLDAAREEHREGDPDVLLEIVAVDAVTSVYDPACHDRVAAEGVRWEALSQRDGWAARALAAVLATVSSIDGRDPAAVLRHAERALEGGTLLSQRSAGAWAAAQLAGSLVAVDAHARALAVCDEIEAQARGCGSLMGLMTAFSYRMWAATRRGELVAVEAELRRVLDMFAEAEIPMMFLSAVWFAMDAIVERPSLADVAASVDAAELEPEFARTWSGGMLLQVRGQLRRQRHDHRGGVADLRAGAEVAGAIAMGPLVSPWRSLLALALGADDRTEAVALVEQEIEIARRGGLARPLAVALRAAGQLDGGPRGVDRLRESLTLLENSVAQLELARTRVELGAALRRRHQRAEARDHLRVGIELARHCGADRLAERGLEELRTAGGRPRAAVWHGAESLTAGELRVARLAVAGLTNSRIAQSLFVSVKTVETHLGHVYAKLNLSGQGSRTQLAAVLGDGDELSFGGDQPSRLVDASSAAG